MLEQYPNWEYALDEEGVEGQDETTLKPASEQRYITAEVEFTAGEVILADGRRFPAILYIGSSSPTRVGMFLYDTRTWGIDFGDPPQGWFVHIWIPADQRMARVSLDDPTLFPMTVASRLPRRIGGTPYLFVINPDGTCVHLKP